MIQEYLHFSKRCWPLLFFGVITIFWGNFGQSFFISWYGASFQESLNLSATEYGTAYSTATLISGLLIMWVGSLIDRVSINKFIIFCSLGLTAACIMLYTASNLGWLIAALFMLRFFGQGLLPHTGVTTMVKEFSINRGKAVSIATTGVPLGEIILPTLAVLLIASLGWQKSWLVIAISVPIIFLPLALWSVNLGRKEKYREAEVPQVEKDINSIPSGSRKTLLTDHRFWLALPVILAAPFIVTGIFIHQAFILPEFGWTPQLFATCFVIYGITHWISSMYAGALVDRFSGTQLLKFFPLPMLLGLFLPFFFSGDWVAMGLLFFIGLTLGPSSPVINGLWAENYGTENLGGIRAMLASFMVISTAISPIMLGYLIDLGITARLLFLGLALYVVVASILACFSYSKAAVE